MRPRLRSASCLLLKSIAVVGSRNATPEKQNAARLDFEPLGNRIADRECCFKCCPIPRQCSVWLRGFHYSSVPSRLSRGLGRIQPGSATIIYTSGTTGEPKGAMLGHDAIMQAMKIHDIKISLGPTTFRSVFLPLCHVFERGWTWYCLLQQLVR